MIHKYGKDFPVGDDLSIEIWAFNNWSVKCGTSNRLTHFKAAMKLLFSSGPKPPLIWTPWTDRRIDSFFNDKQFAIWWGPSAIGKTMDAAAIALTYFIMAPTETTVVVCSTTRDTLEKNIWGKINKLYAECSVTLPFVVLPSSFSITNPPREGEKAKDIESGIFGVAVLRGTYQEAYANLSGRHNRRMVRIVDEMQGTKEVAVDTWENAKGGATEAYFLGMGNPDSWLSVLGKYSMPKDGNTKALGLNTESWETKQGYCEFFNGLKSPGIAEPKKYPFLLNQKQIDETRKNRGENHPIYWQQRIGFVPPEGLLPVVMTETFIMQYKMMQGVTWWSDYKTYAALDPAFSTGGDDAVLTPFSIGRFYEGGYGIFFHPQIVLPLKMSSEKAMTYTLAHDVKAQCEQLGVRPHQFACDTTGMQKMFADILENEWGKGIHRVGFSSAVSNLPDDITGELSSKQAYHRRVDELWGSVAAFGRFGQIRGLSEEAAQQFSARLIVKQIPLTLETKKEMKEHAGRSPDHADSVAVAIDYVRNVLGLLPGGSDPSGSHRTEPHSQANDLDSGDNLYSLSDEMQVATMEPINEIS